VQATDSDGVRIRLTCYKRPGQVFFPGPMHAELRAWVCRACGYTEFYTLAPQDLGEPPARGGQERES
jgi:hypothetical protein